MTGLRDRPDLLQQGFSGGKGGTFRATLATMSVRCKTQLEAA